MKKIIALLILTSVAIASAALTYPQSIMMDYGAYNEQNVYYLGEFDLGKISPGQDLRLVFSRHTGPGNSESDASIFWESAEGNEVSSFVKGMNLEAVHTIPPSVRGNYAFDLTLRGSKLGTIAPHKIKFKLFITEDVYFFEYEKTHEMSAGTTKEITVKIRSESIASDVLNFRNSEGIPSSWIEQDNLVMGPGETKTVTMKITPNEEGMYNAKIKAGRLSSQITDTMPMEIRVKPTLSSKLKAFNEGFSIIPVIMQPFYSLMSLLGSIV